jgi:hypothetical protein
MSSEAFMIGFVLCAAAGCLIGVSATILVLLLPFYIDRDDSINDLSPRSLVLAAVALFVAFGLSQVLKLHTSAAVLLALLTVLVIAHLLYEGQWICTS